MKPRNNKRTGRNPLGVATGLQALLQSQYVQRGARYIKKSIKGKKNPSEDKDDAAEMSEKWHGRKSKFVTELEEKESYETTVAELADLEELGILGSDQVTMFTITFKKDRPKLVCDKKGKNLEIVGGDQSLQNVDGIGMEYEGKQLIPIGYSYCIVYETDKHHLEGSNGYPEPYEHYWGEEFYKEYLDPEDFKNAQGQVIMDDWFAACIEDGLVTDALEQGLLPLLVYNQTDKKMLLVGGKYTVEDVGIKN